MSGEEAAAVAMSNTTTVASGTKGTKGTKGARTRSKLVRAARVVFEDRGYLDCRIADIAAEAGMAVGGFYNYFSSKEEIFLTMVEQFYDEVRPSIVDRTLAPLERIAGVHRYYVDFYRENAKMIGLIESVMTFNQDVLRIRMIRRREIVDLNRRSIERLQADGITAGDIDAGLAATALTSMVVNFLYTWLVMDEPVQSSAGAMSDDDAVRVLTQLWAGALGIEGAIAA